jgi:hypothetical protein
MPVGITVQRLAGFRGDRLGQSAEHISQTLSSSPLAWGVGNPPPSTQPRSSPSRMNIGLACGDSNCTSTESRRDYLGYVLVVSIVLADVLFYIFDGSFHASYAYCKTFVIALLISV